MGQFITLPELIAIMVICLPIWALIKTLIESINNKFK